MIIGPVGCGKSTLLKGILSETPLSRCFVYLRTQSMAFADQEAWIQNGTIRDAIRGPGSRDIPYDNDPWYDEVVDCCGMTQDIAAFSKGDRTLIGSKGISLSGGQKQRLALARAVYSKADVLILDDVFSGLDNDTEELIFRKLFGRSGPLKRLKTTVVLVTHAVHRLPYADLIVSLGASGQVVEQGTYGNLINERGYVQSLDVRFKQETDRATDEADHASETSDTAKGTPAIRTTEDDDSVVQDGLRRTGEWSIYKHWFRSCGYVSSGLSIFWAICWVIAAQAPGVLVKFFGTSSSQATTFIIIFGVAACASAAAIVLVATQIFLDMVPKSSSHLHLNLLDAVINAPLSFFTRTDIGSITNRFSQDMALVDSELPFSYADFVLAFVTCAFGLALIGASWDWVLCCRYPCSAYSLVRTSEVLSANKSTDAATRVGGEGTTLHSVRRDSCRLGQRPCLWMD